MYKACINKNKMYMFVRIYDPYSNNIKEKKEVSYVQKKREKGNINSG